MLTTPNSFYLKPLKEADGGGALWDFAATTALFKAANKPCGDINGREINFNQTDSLYMNKKGVLFAHDLKLFFKIEQLKVSVMNNNL